MTASTATSFSLSKVIATSLSWDLHEKHFCDDFDLYWMIQQHHINFHFDKNRTNHGNTENCYGWQYLKSLSQGLKLRKEVINLVEASQWIDGLLPHLSNLADDDG